MNIPLGDLERIIDKRIVERGMKYYEDGAVDDLEELETGQYEAMVQGSDDYTVNVRVKDAKVVEHDCDCPYDGPVCKHVVAVLLHLRNDVFPLADEVGHAPTKKGKGPVRKPTVAEQVDAALATVLRTELMAFVRERCLENAAFRKQFLVACAPQSMAMDRTDHLKELRGELRGIAGRDRFIDYHDATAAGNVLHDMLDQARKLVAKGLAANALPMITAVILAGSEAIQDADDSNGAIGGGIESGMLLLAQLARGKHDETFRKRLLAETEHLLDDKTVMNCNWNGNLEPIAAMLVHTEEEAAPLMAALTRNATTEYGGSSSREALLDLTRRFKGLDAVAKLEEGYLRFTDVREKAIKEAMARKDWSRARQLAEDGKKVKRNGQPATHEHYWTPHLLHIAQVTKDRSETIRLARTLLIDSHQSSMEHFKLLRKEVAKSEWSAFVEQLLVDMRAGKRGLDRHLIADICAAEQRWDEVMAEARKEGDLPTVFQSVLDQYEQELGRRYPQEVSTTLAERAEGFASKTGPKAEDYVQAVELLRRIKKLGDHQLVQALTADWRVRLARRKGLMEQLDKF